MLRLLDVAANRVALSWDRVKSGEKTETQEFSANAHHLATLLHCQSVVPEDVDMDEVHPVADALVPLVHKLNIEAVRCRPPLHIRM